MSSPGAMAATLPWSNTKVLDEHLRNGELNLATAIGQFGAVVRETLRVLENHANDNVKLNLDRKGKLERLEKLVSDLSEKCQGMQQALLYKEEKYDEKCREVERYKVICELSAKAATSDNMYYTPDMDMNDTNNNRRNDDNHENEGVGAERGLHRQSRGNYLGDNSKETGDLPGSRPCQTFQQPTISQQSSRPASVSKSNANEQLGEGNHNNRVEQWCYLGGPTKRKPASTCGDRAKSSSDLRFQQRLEGMGGINVKAATTNTGPVPIDRLYRPDASLDRIKIAVSGQSNEVVGGSIVSPNRTPMRLFASSSSAQLRQATSSGIYTRYSNRRKKMWPY